MTDLLPSWRPGPRRDAIVEFLDRIGDVPVEERVAYLDNDGTMWTEKPSYVQLDFFVDALTRAAAVDPTLPTRPEFAAVLSGDMARVAEIGLPQVAVALTELFDGQTPSSSPPRSTTSSAATAIAPSAPPSTAWSTDRCSSCSTRCAPTSSPSGSSPGAAPSSSAR
ncbi:MAG: hypothetical protein R2701_00880 [Acidimicrobiales bacterium]